MKETLALDFLYRTVPGRALLKIVAQPWVSRLAGVFLSSGASRRLIPWYRKKYGIVMDDIEIPPGGFASFNDFFTRKRKRNGWDLSDGGLNSPCDGWLTVADITKDTVFRIKHTDYALGVLLQDRALAEHFCGGVALIFRLTPQDYHRYCYMADGRIVSSVCIPGQLHCVRPVALEEMPVFLCNSREYQVLLTERFGRMVQMEVGALLVGRIENESGPLRRGSARAGEEKGHFAFGGSTIVCLFEKDTIALEGGWEEKRNTQTESRVRLGMRLGTQKEPPDR